MSKYPLLFVIPLTLFLCLSRSPLAEEIITEIPPPEPQYVELARVDTGTSADINVTFPLSLEALVLVNLSEEEAYIHVLTVYSEDDQWLSGKSFRKFTIKPGARLDIPLIGPRKINEIHLEGRANIVIRGIVDDGSMVLLEKIRLRSNEQVFTIDGQETTISKLIVKAEGKQDVRIEFIRVNGENLPLQRTTLERDQLLILIEGQGITLSTVQLKAKARKGTSYLSIWAEREAVPYTGLDNLEQEASD